MPCRRIRAEELCDLKRMMKGYQGGGHASACPILGQQVPFRDEVIDAGYWVVPKKPKRKDESRALRPQLFV